MTYSLVQWNSSTLDDCTVTTNGSIQGTGTSNTWDRKAQGTNTFTVGGIKIIPDATTIFTSPNARCRVGIGTDPYAATDPNSEADSLEYDFYLTSNSYNIFDHGSNKLTVSHSLSSSDEFIIYLDSSGYVKWYVNGVLKYTSTSTTTETYYAHFVPNQNPKCFITEEIITAGGSSGSGGSGGSGGSEGSGSTGQMYTSSGSTPHNENRPLQIFKSQRSWF